MSNIPKISVLIICYKQEELIRRALDSIIAQREFVYEICVSDDCSPDNTWEVLKDYDRRYPGLFKLHRNNPNVGIFQNIEYTWTMPTGNMIYQLSGDDAVPEGYFSSICSYVVNNQLDFKKEAFCIYTNYLERKPNGEEILYSNYKIQHFNALKLKIRQLVNNRGCCFSKLILDRFIPVSKGRSYSVELAQDSQLQMFSDENYYISIPGNIYYSQIGVSSNLSRTDNLDSFPFAGAFYMDNGSKIDWFDINYIKYVYAFESFFYYHKIRFLPQAICYFILSIDLRLGWDGLQAAKFQRKLRSLVKPCV